MARNSATSYIKTTTATVTRNAELSFVDLFNNNMLNQNNFTLFVEGYSYNGFNSDGCVFLANATGGFTSSADCIGFWNGVSALWRDTSVTNVINSVLTGSFKFVVQRSGTTVRFFRNGVQFGTTQTITVANYRYLNVNHGGSTYAVDKIFLFNRTLSDADCVLLTT